MMKKLFTNKSQSQPRGMKLSNLKKWQTDIFDKCFTDVICVSDRLNIASYSQVIIDMKYESRQPLVWKWMYKYIIFNLIKYEWN